MCLEAQCAIASHPGPSTSVTEGFKLYSFIHWTGILVKKKIYIQGMVNGSASKPALRQDTGYMVEKTYLDIAPYLGAFGAYLMPQ